MPGRSGGLTLRGSALPGACPLLPRATVASAREPRAKKGGLWFHIAGAGLSRHEGVLISPGGDFCLWPSMNLAVAGGWPQTRVSLHTLPGDVGHTELRCSKQPGWMARGRFPVLQLHGDNAWFLPLNPNSARTPSRQAFQSPCVHVDLCDRTTSNAPRTREPDVHCPSSG